VRRPACLRARRGRGEPEAGEGEKHAEARGHGFTPLRHYSASSPLAEGVDVRTLAEYLGRADPGFTLRTYTRLLPSSGDRAGKGR